MYTFEKVLVDQFAEFNDFVGRSPNGNFRQTTYWGEIKSFSGWLPQYYTLKKHGDIEAVASLLVRKIPFFPFTLIYCCRGPVVEWSDDETCKILFAFLQKVVSENRGFCLRMDPEPWLDESSQTALLCSYDLVKLSERVTGWNRSLYSTRIVLDKSEEELYLQLRRTLRQNINKLNRQGVSVSIEGARTDKGDFFRLMSGLEMRRNSLIHSERYYHKIYDTVVIEGGGFFLKALYQGEVVSGLVVFHLGGKAWALFIANDYQYREMMPNKLLLWEAVKLARNIGCKFLDLGSTQGSVKFDPENDPLDMLKSAYRPDIVQYTGYYDIKGKHYSLFRLFEAVLLPKVLRAYYKLNRIFRKK